MPPCRTCGVDVKAAYDQIDTARRKLELLQEKVTLDQELLKQDKRNFKRRLQAAKAAVKASQAEVDRQQQEMAQASETAKKTRRDQDWRQIQELRDQLKSQEVRFRKERQNLEDRITIVQSSHSARETEQQSEATEHVRKIRDAEAAVRRLELQLTRKNSALESYEQQIRDLQKKLKDDEASLSSQQQQQQQQHQPQKCRQCQTSVKELQALEATLEETAEQFKRAQSEISKERRAKEMATRQVEQKVTELQRLTLEIQQLQNEVENLVTQCDMHKASLGAIREELDTSEETNASLQRQIEELIQRNKTLEEEKIALARNNPNNKPNGVTNGRAGMGEAVDQEILGVTTAAATATNSANVVIEQEWQGAGDLIGVYTGEVDDSNTPHGSGTLRADDGAVYDGEWRTGQRHGNGVYATVEGDLYRGGWKDDLHHGKGTFVWGDGRVFRGDYVHGQRHGYGIMCWPHGANYAGEFYQDKRNGLGRYTHADGRLYAGEYKDDRPHGKGTLQAADGEVIFEGQWELGEQMS